MATLSSLNSTILLHKQFIIANCFYILSYVNLLFYGIIFHAEGTSRDQHIKDGTINISRKASRGFNLIECHSLPISQLTKSLENSTDGNETDLGYQKDVCVYYKLPCGGSSKLNLV